MAPASGAWFVAVALTSATILALAGYWALRYFELDGNPLLTVATALVVGTFVTLFILGRRVRKDKPEPPEAEGFDVVERRV